MGLFDFLKKKNQDNPAGSSGKQTGKDSGEYVDLGMSPEERKKLAALIHSVGISTNRSMPDVERAILKGNKVSKKLLMLCESAVDMNFTMSMMSGKAPSAETVELSKKLRALLKDGEEK